MSAAPDAQSDARRRATDPAAADQRLLAQRGFVLPRCARLAGAAASRMPMVAALWWRPFPAPARRDALVQGGTAGSPRRR